MGFLRGTLGGGARVDTLLDNAPARPGGTVRGVIDIFGGSVHRDVNFIEIALVARAEVETSDSEHEADVVFQRHRISGAFPLAEGARYQLPFEIALPWETPFTVVGGLALPRVRVGLRTELDIARSLDKTDVDPLQVIALPAQEQIITAFAQLGFRLKGSDVEKGRIRGAMLPFYQEVEFAPPRALRGKLNELEVSFIARERDMVVRLELDRRSFFDSHDRGNAFTVDYQTAQRQDWPRVLDEHLGRLISATGFLGGGGRGLGPRLG